MDLGQTDRLADASLVAVATGVAADRARGGDTHKARAGEQVEREERARDAEAVVKQFVEPRFARSF